MSRDTVELYLEDGARKYIAAHGGHALVSAVTPHGCCGGVGASLLSISVESPTGDPEGYLRFDEGGVVIHVSKDLDRLDRLSISLKKFLWLSALAVEPQQLSW